MSLADSRNQPVRLGGPAGTLQSRQARPHEGANGPAAGTCISVLLHVDLDQIRELIIGVTERLLSA